MTFIRSKTVLSASCAFFKVYIICGSWAAISQTV